MSEVWFMWGALFGIALLLAIVGTYRFVAVLYNIYLEARKKKQQQRQAIQDLEDYINRI